MCLFSDFDHCTVVNVRKFLVWGKYTWKCLEKEGKTGGKKQGFPKKGHCCHKAYCRVSPSVPASREGGGHFPREEGRGQCLVSLHPDASSVPRPYIFPGADPWLRMPPSLLPTCLKKGPTERFGGKSNRDEVRDPGTASNLKGGGTAQRGRCHAIPPPSSMTGWTGWFLGPFMLFHVYLSSSKTDQLTAFLKTPQKLSLSLRKKAVVPAPEGLIFGASSWCT